MCLLFFAYECHPHYHLILAANRDEYYDRPTEPAKFWQTHPWVLAGRDLAMQGTWMGITRTGRFAALTNYRDPSLQIENAKSRGVLVSGFLCSDESPEVYLQAVAKERSLYNPFNLLVGDREKLLYFNQPNAEVRQLNPGLYGLSNHFLDTPWPKVQKSKQALGRYLENRAVVETEAIFEMLADREVAEDQELPNTGISKEREKCLSPVFIKGLAYGTRSSTVLLIDRRQHVIFREKSYSPGREEGLGAEQEFKLV